MKCLRCLLPLDDEYHGLHPRCFNIWFGTLSSFSNLSRKSADSSQGTISTQNNSFFHGKFKKYSAELNGSSYILKMQEPEAPELPQVEYLCNQLGKALGIPVAEFFIINFNQEIVFVTKNFITSTTPTDLQHIYHFRDDNQHSCESLIKVVSSKTSRPYDVNVLIKTILFDALIGNHDRHGRNLAFIIKAGQTILSPIYDNVSYLSLEMGEMLKADFNPRGKIATHAVADPTMADYVKELKRLKYHEEIEHFHSNIHLPQIYRLIDNSFCSELMKVAIKTLVDKRYEELSNEK